MPLSLTCTCGAKLEIDDAFAGKTITCPDCRKELSTAPAPIWASHTSWFGLASLVLALAGSLTFILPLLAIGCGGVALWHIRLFPEDVGGRRIAWAGIIVGGFFTLLSVGAYLSPEVLSLDGIFREIEWAGTKLNRKGELLISKEIKEEGFTLNITRTSLAWGVPDKRTGFTPEDDLILINPWQDAFVSCMNRTMDDVIEPGEDMLEKGLDRFLNSEIVQLVSHGKPSPKAQTRNRRNVTDASGLQSQEMLIDLDTIQPRRTFLLRVTKVDSQAKLFIVVGGTRRSRFERLEPELRKIIESYQIEREISVR